MTFRKVVVGISGGVDSAVCALLLKRKGFDVCGVFMKNWDEIDESGQCTGEKDWIDAQYVCEKIDVPVVQVNFVKDYWNSVFCNFLEDYQTGLTPNPDILCNRHIKFDQFFKYSVNQLKSDAIATGHYAKTSFGSFLEYYHPHADVRLLQATDELKDQTFFLSDIKQTALRRTMFPIGNLLKSDVKRIAKEENLHRIAAKRESRGICFIGHRNFQNFISEYLEHKPGNFIDIDTGQVVGVHKGIHHWTIGQRCRISGLAKPYFIARKSVDTNTLLVAAGTNHHALWTRIFVTQKPSWISRDPGNLRCEFRFQHTKPLVTCTVQVLPHGLKVVLDKYLRAITPGQYAVFYLKGECLGCARILKTEELADSCQDTNWNKEFLKNN